MWRSISASRFVDATGTLSVLEHPESLPFKVERVFWLSNISLGAIRGQHAHLDLRQVLVCLKGSCSLELLNVIGESQTITLIEGGSVLYIEGIVWRTLKDFTTDCCLLVLCDKPYKEDKVLRTFAEFKAAQL